MRVYVTIADNDPLIPLLEECAHRRGLAEPGKRGSPDLAKLRKRLPKLARSLISERLSFLKENTDPLAVPSS